MVSKCALLIGLFAAVLTASSTNAAVLCAKPRSDGTFSTSVKIREACTPREMQLDPAALHLQGPPGLPPPSISARVFSSSDIIVPNGTRTVLTFDSERFDKAALHDATAPERLTVPVDGTYALVCHTSWTTRGGGSRLLELWRNGSQVIAAANAPGDPAHHTELTVSTMFQLSAGDFVEARVDQDSGAAVAIGTNPPGLASTLEFSIARLP
jgi:hypothetical protein